MGCRAYVGVMGRDGMVRYIYVHHGGNVEPVSKELQEKFTTYGQVLDLVRGGDRSTLHSDPYPSHSFPRKFKQPYNTVWHEEYAEKLDVFIEAVYVFYPDDVDAVTVESTDASYADPDFKDASVTGIEPMTEPVTEPMTEPDVDDRNPRRALSGTWLFRSRHLQPLPCTHA